MGSSGKPGHEKELPKESTIRSSSLLLKTSLTSGFYDKLNESKALPWVLLLVVCGATAALVAPELTGRQYPAGDELLGTPAQADVKAPYDVAVPDEEKTLLRREAAVAAVGHVYDYDTGLVYISIKRLGLAFSAARARLNGVQENPGLAGNESEISNQFGKSLNLQLSVEESDLLSSREYSRSIEAGILRVIRQFQSQEIVESSAVLRRDTAAGISIQEVPDVNREPRVVQEVNSIKDMAAVNADILAEGGQLLKDMEPTERSILLRLINKAIQPNLTLNRAATELAREVARLEVPTERILIKRGEMIVRDGERMTGRHLLIFGSLNRTSRKTQLGLVVFGAGLIILLLIFASFSATKGQRWRVSMRAREILFLSSTLVLMVACCRLWMMISTAVHESYSALPLEVFAYAMPVATGAMVVRLALRVEAALVFGVLSSLVVALLMSEYSWYAAYAFVGGILGATLIGTLNARGDVIRAGVLAGIGQALFVIAYLLFEGSGDVYIFLSGAFAAFAGGVISGFMALAMTPVVEFVFRYTTELKLLELVNLNHPALKELIVQAPGSYHHSIIVGSLAEAAAEAIGANPLLAKVMAYYHDLGKGCNASYFIENQRSGTNPHDKLNPSMSAMIIRRHVTEGLEIAKRYGLGEQILAGIAEHHGKALIQYFYHKHKENEEKYGEVSEHEYRYPGRKPQTRESALVMIADSIEAAARSIAEPTSARLKGLVNRIINIKFTDGQLDECDLTLRDLHIIAKAFMRVLDSIYHQRVEYPELLKDLSRKKEQLRKEKDNGDSDSKSKKTSSGSDQDSDENRPDDLRRLGL